MDKFATPEPIDEHARDAISFVALNLCRPTSKFYFESWTFSLGVNLGGEKTLRLKIHKTAYLIENFLKG
jgi:hypothetical protein